MGVSFVLRNIGELLTLWPAQQKQARFIKESDLGRRRKHALVVSQGRIAWLGPERALPRQFARRLSTRARRALAGGWPEVDLQGATLMPAFVECHTHLCFAGERQHDFELRNQGLSYQAIAKNGGGILSTVRATRAATFKELRELAQARVERFVAQGCTTIEAKSGYGLSFASELKQIKVIESLSGARMVSTFLGAHAVPPEESGAESYLNKLCDQLMSIREKTQCRRVDIFIEKAYFSVGLARRYLRAAQALGFELVVHADQLTRTGAAVAASRLKAKSVDHCLQLRTADIEELARSQTTCVLLPVADLYLHLPYPRARALIDQGARVALASDFNPGSAPSQELSLVGCLARLEMKMSLPEVLAAYTTGAAHALGLEQELGSLAVGRMFDATLLHGHWDELFYQIGHHPVQTVWREGKILFQKK